MTNTKTTDADLKTHPLFTEERVLDLKRSGFSTHDCALLLQSDLRRDGRYQDAHEWRRDLNRDR